MRYDTETVLIHLLLDGFDSSYLDHAPFLSEHIGNGRGRPLRIPSIFGARGMIFSGTLPGANQVFTDMWRDPKHSRFRFLRHLPFFRPLKYGTVRRCLQIAVRLSSGYPCPLPDNLPGNMLSRFDAPALGRRFSVFRGPATMPTLLDYLRNAGIPFQYFGPPFSGFWKKDLVELAEAIKPATRYVFVHVVSPDLMGHRYGPSSSIIAELIGHLDGQTERFHAALSRRFRGAVTLIHSDHGMSEISRFINLWERVIKWPFEAGVDFDYFVDSTMIRFWILNSSKTESVREKIKTDLPEATLLTSGEKEKLGLEGLDSRFGEEIAVIREGDLIFPNFYQSNPIRGMHGYSEASSHGFFAWSGVGLLENEQAPSLLDIFPTVLYLLHVRPTGPVQGRVLLTY